MPGDGRASRHTRAGTALLALQLFGCSGSGSTAPDSPRVSTVVLEGVGTPLLLLVGDSATVLVRGVDLNGTPVPNAELRASTSPPDVVSIVPAGEPGPSGQRFTLRALAPGETVATFQEPRSRVEGRLRVIVGPPGVPVVELSADSLTFQILFDRRARPSETLTLANAGGGLLVWTLEEDAVWLSATPESGVGPANVVLQASLNCLNLAPGTHRGALTVAASGAAETRTVVLTLIVGVAGHVCDV